jgi:hypothetical protein
MANGLLYCFFFGDTKFEIFMKTTAKLIAW